MGNTTTILSSWGSIIIETPSGKIIEKNIYTSNEECYIDDIYSFDIIEFNDWFFRRYGFQPNLEQLDILELGYTKKDGTYIEPSNWRYEIREELEKDGELKIFNNI